MHMQSEIVQGSMEHPGVVERLEGNKVYVRIEATSACGNCQSASYCGMAEVEEKIVEAAYQQDVNLAVGMPVIVTLNKALGFRALILGYLIPLLILVAGVVVVAVICGNEPLAALTGVLLLIPYYALLYVNRKRLKNRFRFQIKIK